MEFIDKLAFEINDIMYNWNTCDYYDNFTDKYSGYRSIYENLLVDPDFKENVIDELIMIGANLSDDDDENIKLYGFTFSDVSRAVTALENL